MSSAFITINSVDSNASGEFYKSVFDATHDPDQDFNLGGFVYLIGNLRIVILHNARVRTADTFPHHAMVMLTIEVDDVLETYRKAVVSAGTIIDAPESSSDELLMTDPDGITITAYQISPE